HLPRQEPRVRGNLMASFYGGKVECRVVGREVPDVAVLDFSSQYPSLYRQLGVEKFLIANRIRSRSGTSRLRADGISSGTGRRSRGRRRRELLGPPPDIRPCLRKMRPSGYL